MPDLTIIAACDRVLIDKVGIASLINIFQRLEIAASPTAYPADAVSPIRWSVYTQWHHPSKVPGISYVQRVEVLKPSGDVFVSAQLSFVTDETYYSRHQIEIMGLPLGYEGLFKIRAWLDGHSESSGEYDLELKYTKVEETTA